MRDTHRATVRISLFLSRVAQNWASRELVFRRQRYNSSWTLLMATVQLCNSHQRLNGFALRVHIRIVNVRMSAALY